MGIKCSEKCLGYLHSEVDYHVFIIIVPLKWPLYPKCVTTIGRLFKLEMIESGHCIRHCIRMATISMKHLFLDGVGNK